jgi:hypothetical protein
MVHLISFECISNEMFKWSSNHFKQNRIEIRMIIIIEIIVIIGRKYYISFLFLLFYLIRFSFFCIFLLHYFAISYFIFSQNS